jgi:hypothetical protein
VKVKWKEKDKKKKDGPIFRGGICIYRLCVKSEVQSRIKKKNSAGCFLHAGLGEGKRSDQTHREM